MIGRRGLFSGMAGIACCSACSMAPSHPAPTPSVVQPGSMTDCPNNGAAQSSLPTCRDFTVEDLRSIAAPPRPRDTDAVQVGQGSAQCDAHGFCFFEAMVGRHRIRVEYFLAGSMEALPSELRAPVLHPLPPVTLGPGITLGSYRVLRDVPRQVQFTMLCAAHALRRYAELGFRDPLRCAPDQPCPPPTPGAGTLTLRLSNQLGSRGSTSSGDDMGQRILLERSLTGEAMFTTIAHEIFHRIQYRYNVINRAGPFGEDCRSAFSIHEFLREGTARLAEELLIDRGNRYIEEGRRWFTTPGLSLVAWRQPLAEARPGYRGGLFWKYVAEQHSWAKGQPSEGADVLKAVLLATRDHGAPAGVEYHVACLRRAWSALVRPGHFDQFLRFGRDLSDTLCEETSWGNFLVALALNGSGGPDSRFRFLEAAEWRDAVPARLSIPAARGLDFTDLPEAQHGEAAPPGIVFSAETLSDDRVRLFTRNALGGILRPADTLVPAADGAAPRFPMLPPYAMLAYQVALPRAVLRDEAFLLRIQYEASSGLPDALVQILVLDHDGLLIDLIRHDATAQPVMTRVVSGPAGGKVIVLVGSREAGGDFRLGLSRVTDRPLLSISGWNCPVRNNLPLDPALFVWDWRSRDVFWDPDERKLRVMVHNTGRATARGVSLDVQMAETTTTGGFAGWSAPVTLSSTEDLPSEQECRSLAILGRTDGCRVGPSTQTLGAVREIVVPWPEGWPGPSPQGVLLRLMARDPDDPQAPGRHVLASIGGWQPPPAWLRGWNGNLRWATENPTEHRRVAGPR